MCLQNTMWFVCFDYIKQIESRCDHWGSNLWCTSSIDGRILDCKLVMHVNCFDEIRKNVLYNVDSKHDSARNGKSVTTLEKLKSCCHPSPQMVHGGDLRYIVPIKTVITIKMDILFVWSPFMLGLSHQWIRPHRSWRWREMREEEKEMNALSVL